MTHDLGFSTVLIPKLLFRYNGSPEASGRLSFGSFNANPAGAPLMGAPNMPISKEVLE